jgi:3-oxoacyl-[acyl-carrier protein] reductase
LTYSKNKAAVDNLISQLQATGLEPDTKFSSHKVDMGSLKDMEHLFEEIEEIHGHGPEILVSNAGHGKRIVSILDIPLEEFDYTMEINLRASFILSKLAVPHMISRKWGRIIYMGSIAGYGGGVNGCHYAASKAGLQGMAKNLALKLAAPAMIGETGMIPNAKILVGTPGDVANIPVQRLGTPKEVANVVTMLCKTGYLTGQSIIVSGGLK